MVQAVINIGDHEDRILATVKGKFGFRNKSDAMNFIISKYEEELLEPELKPEFVEKIRHLDKNGKFSEYKTVSELRKSLEHA